MMEGGGRRVAERSEEEKVVQRSETVRLDQHQEEELETPRLETAADSLSMTEEATEEMEIP